MYNWRMQPTGFIVMGVSGSGKSTLGQALVEKLGWDFFDADDFHPSENIAKMAAGIPLNDSDRTPWLTSLSDLLLFMLKAERHPVLACSAMKESYRQQLLVGINGIEVIYLKGSYELIQERMSERRGVFYEAGNAQKSVFYTGRAEKRPDSGYFHAVERDGGLCAGEKVWAGWRFSRLNQT